MYIHLSDLFYIILIDREVYWFLSYFHIKAIYLLYDAGQQQFKIVKSLNVHRQLVSKTVSSPMSSVMSQIAQEEEERGLLELQYSEQFHWLDRIPRTKVGKTYRKLCVGRSTAWYGRYSN